MDTDTIAAIATPVGRGGIGIIRISGAQAQAIAQRLFFPVCGSRQSPVAGSMPATARRLTYGQIQDPRNGLIIDEVLLVVMPAPHSYTREDVVEIQAHGGPILLEQLLTLVLFNGARLAEPGEFTRRAFLNGRIDLSQAEAVADLINAKCENARSAASHQLSGRLRYAIEQMIEVLVGLRTEIEAGIEFSDEVCVASDSGPLILRLQANILAPIARMLASYADGRLLRDGVRLAIIGKPNVGKSSLLNALIDQQRAIVTPFPGTTRDMIEEALTIDGLPVVLADTAGLHDSNDPIEILGIQKTLEAIEAADLILLVIEAGLPPGPADLEAYRTIGQKKALLVINKTDLLENPQQVVVPEPFQQLMNAPISALCGSGIPALKKLILHACLMDQQSAPQAFVLTNIRHKQCLEDAFNAIRQATQSLAEELSEDIVAMDCDLAITALKSIVGQNFCSDVLDRIFQQFCIGK